MAIFGFRQDDKKRIAELEQQVEALTEFIRNMDDVGGEVMATSIVEWESILAEHGATTQQGGGE